MESWVSLLCSQESTTGPCHEPVNPVHTLTAFAFKLYLSTVLPSARSPKWSLPFRFTDENVAQIYNFSHPCYMPCPSDSTWLMISLVVYGEDYKLWSPSLYKFLHYPVTFSLLVPNILLSTLFSDTFNFCSSLRVTTTTNGNVTKVSTDCLRHHASLQTGKQFACTLQNKKLFVILTRSYRNGSNPTVSNTLGNMTVDSSCLFFQLSLRAFGRVKWNERAI